MKEMEKKKTIMSLDYEEVCILFESLKTEFNHLDAIKSSCRNDPQMKDGMTVSEKKSRVWDLYCVFAEVINGTK